MDVFAATKMYKALQPTEEQVNERKLQGAAAAGAGVGSYLFMIIILFSMFYSGYVSWTSNKVLDDYLLKAGQAVPAGGFVNFFKALSAFTSPFSYPIYYLGFKKHRITALQEFMKTAGPPKMM